MKRKKRYPAQGSKRIQAWLRVFDVDGERSYGQPIWVARDMTTDEVEFVRAPWLDGFVEERGA